MTIPLTDLFGLPSIELPSLSPEGDAVAALRRDLAGNVVVVRRDLASGRETEIARFRRRPLDLRYGPDGLIFVVADADGSERPQLLVYAADGTSTAVSGLPPGYLALPEQPVRGDQVIVYAAGDSGLDCLAVDRKTWAVSRVLGVNDGSVMSWLTDRAGELVARIRRLDDGTGVMEAMGGGRRLDLDSVGQLVGVSGPLLYFTEFRGDTLALCQAEGVGEPQVLVQDGQYDVGRILRDPESGRPQLAEVVGAERQVNPVTDEARTLVAALPSGARILALSAGAAHALVRVQSPSAPPVLAVVARDGQRTDIGSEYEALAGVELSQRRPFAIEARDGLRLEGYLTLPCPGKALSPPSAVVMAHGGPWARKEPGFDPEALWLADRGYAVAQINFRGSAGYGLAFLRRGFRDWGGAMQDDVDDTARWLVEQGHAQPDRVAVVGGSYGGYVAALAAVRSGFAYRCALAFSPPVDLPVLVASTPAHWGAYADLVRQRVGHPERDADALRERSPLYRIADRPIPILIAHGANDPYVPKRPVDEFVDRLRSAGGRCVYLEFGSEGHDLLGLHEEMAFYAAAERFLADEFGICAPGHGCSSSR